MSEDIRVELARKALAASKAADDTTPGTRGHRDALAMWGELEAALAALLDYLTGSPLAKPEPEAEQAAPYAPGQRVTDTEGSVCATCGNDKWEFTGPHPMEPTTVGMFRCNRHGGHPLAIPYSTVTPVVQQTVADLTITEARGMLADSRADKAELTGNDRLLADRWWGRLHNEVELLLTLIDERAEQEPPGGAVTQADAPQTPPPCPPWCVTQDLHEPGASLVYHQGERINPGGLLARPAIAQQWSLASGWGEAHVTLTGDHCSADYTARQARVMAETIEWNQRGSKFAAALREAAGELDRITGAGA